MTTATTRRLTVWGLLGAILTVGLAYAFWPRPLAVDMIELKSGPLVVTADEEGETRVRDVFVLSAPVTGRMRRIELEAGDEVIADKTVVAEIEPIDPAFLDPRSAAQAEATVHAAEAAKVLAEAELEQADAELTFARTELDRAQRLLLENTVSQRDLDSAERTFKSLRAAYATAEAGLQVRVFDLERARAQLLSPVETQALHGRCECIPIRAPVDGRILRVLNESEGVINAGQPLIEIGDPSELEVFVDLLSVAAVKVRPGQRVIIDHWGGESELAGRVRRIEPFGFTKVSALGIEEQRVNVRIDFTSPPDQWKSLGHGFQVEVRIVLWEDDNVLKLPLTALFRAGDDWAVYAEQDAVARKRVVGLGRQTGLEAEIVAGLEAGTQIVAYPSDRVGEGTRITARKLH